MNEINLIAAVSLNMCIGSENGTLPWHYNEDLRKFKQLTENHIVVMGGKTFRNDLKSKPLTNRINIVLTKDKKWKINEDNCYLVYDLITVFNIGETFPNKKIWIIGGASIYLKFIRFVKNMYITHIFETCDGLTYFDVNWSDWKRVTEEPFNDMCFAKYIRK